MPQFNHLHDWHGLDIQVFPAERWRQKLRFWPYFVGQKARLLLKIRKPTGIEAADTHFYIVEKMPDAPKPRIVTPLIPQQSPLQTEMDVAVDDVSRITGKGELRYWLSTHGYTAEGEPIFTAEAINLDVMILPLMVMLLGPMLGCIVGYLLGLMAGSP